MPHPEESGMPAIKYRVTLTEEEVELLEGLVRKGKSEARKQTRARILLKAAAGCQDAEIIAALAVSATMIYNTRQNVSRKASKRPCTTGHDRERRRN